MTADDLLGNGGAYRDKALDQQQAAGVQLLRVNFNWATIEIGPNNFDWATYDKYVLDAAKRNITLLPVLFFWALIVSGPVSSIVPVPTCRRPKVTS